MNIFELKNIYKTFDKNNYVVNNVSFSVEDGDFIVIIGPSGCGKTTLLNMIAGLEEITKGELLINNKEANNIEAKDRDISMVFQNYALYPNMSVYDNIAFPLKNKKVDKSIIEEKVNKVSKLLKIDTYLNRKPSELSGGQKQRVAIGRAIVRNPIVFLMDEPLSNLDTALRNDMREEIKKLHKKLNSTIIYVTHDQIEALTLATKIIVMNDGVIEQIGTPLEIFNKPKNEFVACFLGTPKMNIFNKIDYELEKDNLIVDFFGYKITRRIKNAKLSEAVDVGIRSENFELGGGKEFSIRVKVEYSELIGDSYLIHGKITNNNKNINIKLKISNTLYNEKDDVIYVKPNIEKVYLFNNKTKESI